MADRAKENAARPTREPWTAQWQATDGERTPTNLKALGGKSARCFEDDEKEGDA